MLAATIVDRINLIDHVTYAEPFVGMGGVFFRRDQLSAVEVMNDLNGEVANFFRVLQRHYVAFVEMLRFQITSRREFQRLSKTEPSTLTDMERAARFLYLQRTSFGGKVSGQNFGVSPSTSARFDITKLAPMLEDLHERLSGVVIECLPYFDFIRRYDRPGTLFYLDPPYWGCENDYGTSMFNRGDFETLRSLLSELKGRFVLSLNDLPQVRDTFGEFFIETEELSYSISAKGSKRVRELIISNVDLASSRKRLKRQPTLFDLEGIEG